MTIIDNAAQLALFMNLPQERLYPGLMVLQTQQSLSGLASQATVTVVGPDTVANRAATQLEIVPQASSQLFDAFGCGWTARPLFP